MKAASCTAQAPASSKVQVLWFSLDNGNKQTTDTGYRWFFGGVNGIKELGLIDGHTDGTSKRTLVEGLKQNNKRGV